MNTLDIATLKAQAERAGRYSTIAFWAAYVIMSLTGLAFIFTVADTQSIISGLFVLADGLVLTLIALTVAIKEDSEMHRLWGLPVR